MQQNTQMSETIQFLAAAGQTGTTHPNMSIHNSSIDHQTLKDNQNNMTPSTGNDRLISKIQPVLNKTKSRNGLKIVNLSSTNDIMKQSLVITSSMEESLGDCSIKILQNHNAPKTMNSDEEGNVNVESSYSNSIDHLSKVSPYF